MSNEELALRARNGDQEAKAQLLTRNERLVWSQVHRFRKALEGMEREDLYVEGALGLLRAVDTFDPDRGSRFTTYAVFWIRQAISRAYENQNNMIRVPHSATRRGDTQLSVISLDAPITHDGNNGPNGRDRTLADLLPGGTDPAEDYALLGVDDRYEAILRAMGRLCPPDREMLRLWLQDGGTVREVGEHYGISRQAAHQRLQRALRRLRIELTMNMETTDG